MKEGFNRPIVILDHTFVYIQTGTGSGSNGDSLGKGVQKLRVIESILESQISILAVLGNQPVKLGFDNGTGFPKRSVNFGEAFRR